MSFVVIEMPGVDQVVRDHCTPGQLFHYQMILSLLREDPFPSPQFGDIEQFWGMDGRPFFEFYDGITPVVLVYRVYEPDTDDPWQPGGVLIIRAIPVHDP